VVVLEQSTEPFSALDRAVTLMALAGRRKEQDIGFSLMISLMMIMGSILREGVPQGFFPKENQLRQTLLLDGSHPAFRMGVQIRRPWRQDHALDPYVIYKLLKH
jgi:hypothetical protein